ncbi:hypothetical protein HK103_001562 [Boothiomyces macroporosus]|uniref:Uncharacterized protein n=1 Tax=Boothiomyces macroporosus TaxID=261099 RepID=A0AAD5UA97_9FUNG|nr:hypothetical protein HK103_001562 [Boothiomyces macroporosus]
MPVLNALSGKRTLFKVITDDPYTVNTDSLPISPTQYFGLFHGVQATFLKATINHFHSAYPERSIIYLSGDSSLDNKHWIDGDVETPESYRNVLEPAIMKPDVSFNIMSVIPDTLVVNTAVEATTIADRDNGLLESDCLIRDNIKSNDILVTSIGGNDIALRPTLLTKLNLLMLVYLNSMFALTNYPNLCFGTPYFKRLLGTKVQKYLERLTAKTKPKTIYICMIYYPDEQEDGGWADRVLQFLNYNKNPAKVQKVIETLYLQATCNIKIEGTKVIPVPLYEAMNGKDTNDYVQRVEPSSIGGRKIAELLKKYME